MGTICDIDCDECTMKNDCKGCVETNGHPCNGDCVLATYCGNKKDDNSSKLIKEYKIKLIDEINNLGIDIPKLTELYSLNGSFINMEYKLPNNKSIKFWNDNDIYLGTQIQKDNHTCYGIVADDNYILVCEYEKNGKNPQIIIFKKRNK